jgi:flagellar biosynthesis protein FlhF
MVLVGPTGVGKTTTIAKLAARAKINERRRVGLITLDTFRIAAVDQLEKYAEIINLPLSVATEPRELAAAVAELRARQMDLVLIDSAGRSQRDELKMAELREFLAVLPEAEVHLVLSTTTHGKTLLSVANRFAGIGIHSLILTKVDETISFGALVNALIAIGRPISFVTDGQNVPDDIVASDPERLADLVLKANVL